METGNNDLSAPRCIGELREHPGRIQYTDHCMDGDDLHEPPMCYISVRPERYSYDIIKRNMEFVINLTTKDMARATDWCGVRSGKSYNKFEEMKLTPGKSTVVSAPLIEESPLCIECRVKEIVALGSHDMFIADVVNVRADTSHLNTETGKLELAESNLLVYVHGGYYELGEKIGKFGWSVEKKK